MCDSEAESSTPGRLQDNSQYLVHTYHKHVTSSRHSQKNHPLIAPVLFASWLKVITVVYATA